MNKNMRNFIRENKDYYVNGFIKDWWCHIQCLISASDLRKEIKKYMYEYKNIDYVDFRLKEFKDILNEIVNILNERGWC